MAKTTNLIPRGRKQVGTIVKAKAQKTATLEYTWKRFVPKYERFLVRRTRLTVHNPSEIDAKTGDIVEVQECRPISKTKSFIITKIMGKDLRFLHTQEEREQAKQVTKEKKTSDEEEQ